MDLTDPLAPLIGPPLPPPLGVGSLAIRTGSPDDKAAFGNQVDFVGMAVTDLTAVSFFAFTTLENIQAPGTPTNLPNIAIEIEAGLGPIPLDNFTTMVYSPPSTLVGGWHEFNAFTDPVANWRLTGAEGDTIACNQTTACTFETLVTNLVTAGGDRCRDSLGGDQQGPRPRLHRCGGRSPDQRHRLRLRAQRGLRNGARAVVAS